MLEKRIIQLIKILLYFVLFAPAIVTYSTSYPFLHGKVFWIEICTEIALAFYLILVSINKKYLPKKTNIFWAVSAFIGAIFLSTIFSVDRNISFWGDWSRMTGLIFYLHLYVFFIILSSVILDKQEQLRYFIFISILGSGLSVIAWFQSFGIALLRDTWEGSRVGSTMDNPIFFAVFLIFIVFFNFYVAINTKGRVRALFILLGVFNYITIFLTGTRGAILGIILGLFFVVFYKAIYAPLKWKLTFFIFIATTTFLFLSPFSADIYKLPGLDRLSSVNFYDITAKTRLISWGVALEAFKSRPILGWGHETFFAVFNKFYNPEIAKLSLSETWFDKPHNMFLEILLGSGIIGLLAFLSIFALISKEVFLKKDKRYLAPIFGFFLIGYFTTNFFEFDNPSSLLLLFTVFSIFHFWSNNPSSQNLNEKNALVSKPSVSATSLICIALIIIILFIPAKSLLASNQIDKLANLINVNRSSGLDEYNKFISNNNRYSTEILLEHSNNLSTYFLDNIQSLKEHEDWFDTTLTKLEQAIKKHRYDARYVLAYATLSNALGLVDQKFAIKSEEVLENSSKIISSDRPQILLLLGETKILLDKRDEAINLIGRAQELTPNSKDIAYRLAIAYFASGLEKEGFDQLEKAKNLGMEEIGAQPLLVLISVNANTGNWVKVTELYELAVKLEPKNAKLYAQMAAAYATIGNKPKAKIAVLKAIELDPSLRTEGESFLRQLK